MKIWIHEFLHEADMMGSDRARQLLNYVPNECDEIRADMQVSARLANLYARTREMTNLAKKHPTDKQIQKKCRTAQMICGTVFEEQFPEVIDRHFRVMVGGDGKAYVVLVNVIKRKQAA